MSSSVSARDMSCYRELVSLLIKRDIAGRYRGSMAGLLWSFLNPLIMLIVYTIVFGAIFKPRWIDPAEGKFQYALTLFVGLVVHGIFAESARCSSTMILANVNYVKKVVFPLEILAIVVVGSALFHSFVSLIVLVVFHLAGGGKLHWALLALPIVLVPVVLLSLGIAWMLGALSVYMKDVAQMVGVLSMAMLFLSPVFYPASAVPTAFRILIDLNPLTWSIEHARTALFAGRLPEFSSFIGQCAVMAVFAWLGFIWFQRARQGFADVL